MHDDSQSEDRTPRLKRLPVDDDLGNKVKRKPFDEGEEPEFTPEELMELKMAALSLMLSGNWRGAQSVAAKIGLRHRMEFSRQLGDLGSLVTITPLPGARTTTVGVVMEAATGVVVAAGWEAHVFKRNKPYPEWKQWREAHYILPFGFDPVGKTKEQLDEVGERTGIGRI